MWMKCTRCYAHVFFIMNVATTGADNSGSDEGLGSDGRYIGGGRDTSAPTFRLLLSFKKK
jgi:hypothetical protein